ncbi:hypothetical protein [Adhaeribacter radiodurans]|uniref:Uncharacterized protein n=1 Tax=Adhaeribacter radiodurans TaxID=2745197 RepID=A0A7L7LAJ5_9BACT|nr:hypothetical protein [Adhaeribacter radiodurans]QMU29757.1 hypothetical protein HUW48_17775 [Adhaeribacter radiodurans]
MGLIRKKGARNKKITKVPRMGAIRGERMDIAEELWLKIPLRLMPLGRFISQIDNQSVVFSFPYLRKKQLDKLKDNVFPDHLICTEFTTMKITLPNFAADSEFMTSENSRVLVDCYFINAAG